MNRFIMILLWLNDWTPVFISRTRLTEVNALTLASRWWDLLSVY